MLSNDVMQALEELDFAVGSTVGGKSQSDAGRGDAKQQRARPREAGHFGYRPEIDGLRAVAVMMVLWFHAGLGLKGGFTGVDVFFVISGYLICSIILGQMETGRFRLRTFFERRVRRIAPALVVTMVATAAAAWYLLLPDDFARLGGALAAQPLMLGNVYHWRTSDYFAPAAEQLPLLHTWSLAVEEQFYLAFPVAMACMARWRRSWMTAALGAGLLASLAFSAWATPRYVASSYFLLPTRAWELLIGVVLAVAARRAAAKAALEAIWEKGRPKAWWHAPLVRETLGALSLALIVACGVYYHEELPFPGTYALGPCLGAAGFIWFNRGETLTWSGKLLASRAFVFVGLVSYPLYLVHWPIMVFYKYWNWEPFRWSTGVTLIAASFAAALAIYYLVEEPIRRKLVFRRTGPLVGTVAASLLVILVFGASAWYSGGFPNRYPADVHRFLAARVKIEFNHHVDLASIVEDRLPEIGAKEGPLRCMVWGDSHALALVPMVHQLCQEAGVRGVQLTHSATPPLVDFDPKASPFLSENPRALSKAAVRYALDHRVPLVIMAAHWTNDCHNPLFEASLRKTVSQLVEGGVRVVLVKDVAAQEHSVPVMLARAVMHGRDTATVGVSLDKHRAANQPVDRILDDLASDPRVVVVDPASAFVTPDGLWRVEHDGQALYRDQHHLTSAGATRLKSLFEVLLP